MPKPAATTKAWVVHVNLLTVARKMTHRRRADGTLKPGESLNELDAMVLLRARHRGETILHQLEDVNVFYTETDPTLVFDPDEWVTVTPVAVREKDINGLLK